ncbi:MFS transporter [Pantoea sp. BAV 3049]|uniref:MFS transporter n=1 Tax=Pantoea sp. BAV 3049 TaxID=2654188 RepID=UPI00131EAC01|nr:MFS transporter [Pantoea sp. BAV 3049]
MQALLILMLGAFVSQTTEYLPIGLLPQIAGDLHVSLGATGWLVTGYAWIITLTALPFTLMTRHIDRRTLFLALLGTITLSNSLALVTHNYWMLVAIRLIAALGHGVFWSILAAYAVRILPQMSPGRATAWVFSGISVAIIVGVPLSSAVGLAFGWQKGFGLFGLLGLLTFIGGYFWLPSIKTERGEGKAGLPQNNAPLYAAAFTTLLIITAHFNGYTYITSLLSNKVHIPDAGHPMMLLAFGLAGAVGTVLAGWFDHRPMLLAVIASAGIVMAQILMLPGVAQPVLGWVEMVLWGMSVSMLIVGLQSWVIQLAPEQPEAASALYVSTFNIGIGGGALTGGIMLASSGAGGLLWLGIALGILALASYLLPGILRQRQLAKATE